MFQVCFLATDRQRGGKTMSAGWVTTLAVVLAVIVFFVSNYLKASPIESVTFVFLSEILLGLFNFDRLLRAKVPERIEHIQKEEDVIRKARQMRARARHSLHCIWCSMEYDAKLKEYFEEFRGLDLVVYRLINVKRRPDKVADHINRFIKEIRSGKYVVTSTSHEAFEFLISDRDEAMLLVPHPTKYGLSEGVHSTDLDFAYAIYRMYEGLANVGNQLSIPPEKSDEDAKAIIDSWIKKCCT